MGAPAPTGQLRVLLILGRVSNLPTVWSNCLAAWLLCGGGEVWRFSLVLLSATFFYTGGMFLNDACDVAFDRRYRPERPIPAGQISVRAVRYLAIAQLLAALILAVLMGKTAIMFGLLLVSVVVVYDFVHKGTPLAPLLMAGCRFLVYFLASSAAVPNVPAAVGWRALALSAYIAGLSLLARGESRPDGGRRWPWLLFLAPIVAAFAIQPPAPLGVYVVAAVFSGWLAWCWLGGVARLPASGVAGLLAGIVLVDWLAVAHLFPGVAVVFIGLFLLALVLQRAAPAT